jgi:hypothetical protein
MIMQRQVEVSQSVLNGELLCIATFLPVRRWIDIIPFLQMSHRVERQLKESPGLVRYGLRTDILRKQFWTTSVWKDRNSMSAFVSAHSHATAVRKFQQWAGEGAAFVEWNSGYGRIDWNEVLKRLQTPTFYYRSPGWSAD